MARFEQFHVMDKAVLSRGLGFVRYGGGGGSAMSLLSVSVVYAKEKGGGKEGQKWGMDRALLACFSVLFLLAVLRLLLVAQLFRGEGG